jgi:acyl-CoA synthetase (AMP-forming)/AMP-acid ligase II
MLHQVIREAARRFGSDAAIVAADGWPVGYVDLDRLSDEAGAWLVRRGLGPGDVLGLALPPSPEYVVAYLAAAKVGAVTAGVNPRLSTAERQTLFELVEPRLVLATADLAPDTFDVESLEPAADAGRVLQGQRVDGAPPPLPDDPDRPIAAVFTSGTTGRPKAAVFAGRQLEAITEIDIGDVWGGGGRFIASTSLAHVGFTTKLPWYLRLGSATYLMHRWTSTGALRLVGEQGITNLGGVPTQLAMMLRDPVLADTDVSSVSTIVLGGGPAPAVLVTEGAERFGAPVSARYSSTETGGCGTGTAFDDPPDDRLGVGLPRGPITVSILDDDDRPVPAGEVGEVCVRTPSAMVGYWRNPEATAAAFTSDGSVRTGDRGRLDGNGRLHLVGRSKEMYVRGGYNVYPAEVEDVLAGHPRVASIAVVSRPDEVMGEVGVAIVVPRDESHPPVLADLRQFAAGRLASYKLPDEVRVRADLPLTPMDKLDRRALEAEVRGSS